LNFSGATRLIEVHRVGKTTAKKVWCNEPSLGSIEQDSSKKPLFRLIFGDHKSWLDPSKPVVSNRGPEIAYDFGRPNLRRL